MQNMKGLRDITALTSAPALEDLLYVSALQMEPGDFAELLKSKALKQILVGFGSARKNEALRGSAAKAGIAEYEPRDFEFR